MKSKPKRARPTLGSTHNYVSMWERTGTAERTACPGYANRVDAERRAAAVDGVRCVLPADWDAGRAELMRKLGAA